MDTTQLTKQMDETIAHYEDELKKLRTGRAHAGTLESVQVEVYGQMMPLTHVASITVADAQLLQVNPFDKNNLDVISAAIREDASLGLNPADDGNIVRVPIPPMTEERRLEVVKQLKIKAEDSKVSLRNARHAALKTAKSDDEISTDDYKGYEKKLNEIVDGYNSKIDEMAKLKEQEIMTV